MNAMKCPRRSLARALCVAGSISAGLGSIAAPRVAWSGIFTFGPGLDLGLRSEQPPSFSSSTNGWMTGVAPHLTIQREGIGSHLQLDGRRLFEADAPPTGPSRTSDLASLGFATTPNPTSALSVNARYLRSRDPLHFDQGSQVTFTESAMASGEAGLDLWRLAGNYQVRSHTYQAATANDGISQTWDAAIFPFRRPDTRGLIGWYGRDVIMNRARALLTEGATVGMRRVHFPGLESEIQVGAAETRDIAAGTQTWDPAFIVGATVERGVLRLPFDTRFHFTRDATTTGFVEASLPSGRSLLVVRWESELGAEGGVFSDPTRARFLSVEVRDTLAGRFALSIEGSAGRTESWSAPEQWLKSYRGWVSLSREIVPWLTAGFEYSYLRQDGSTELPPSNYRRNRLGFSLTMGSPGVRR